jgi:redox-sensitive bicupin YhaK (pirin superfamily)
MDDPRYGTEPPENIPVVSFGSAEGAPAGFARVLAGELGGQTGPFQTVQPVQIADYTLSERSEVTHTVTDGLDNCLVFVYKGAVSIGAHTAAQYQCVRLDAHSAARSFTVRTTAGASFMVFAGKMLHQPIAWHGPFVMTTDAEIRQTLREYSQGTFLKKRAEWDYKRIATKPVQV